MIKANHSDVLSMITPLFISLLIQVFLVGMLIGAVRTVLPVISEVEYGLLKNSLNYITSIILAFGIVKALSNIFAGFLSEFIGRKKVLVTGWVLALPIPFLFVSLSNWTMIILALILLGVNQGLAWSMTQSSKIDITHDNERGHAMGLNEFAGYIGVALAGFLTGVIAEVIEPITTISLFTGVIVFLGLSTALFTISETKPSVDNNCVTVITKPVQTKINALSSFQLMKLVSWQDKKMMAICQAGLIEKFVDALIWVFFPIYFYQNGLNLVQIGLIVAIYGVIWGIFQLFTGKLSDIVGRATPIVVGMLLCALGVLLIITDNGLLWWSFCSALIGVGMALLYPNLSAAITDLAIVEYRSSILGIYRFWRDIGYSIAGIIFVFISHVSGDVIGSFIFVSAAMSVSALVLGFYLLKPTISIRAL